MGYKHFQNCEDTHTPFLYQSKGHLINNNDSYYLVEHDDIQ